MKKPRIVPFIFVTTFCAVAALMSTTPIADAQTNATPSSCHESLGSRCFIDSDLPELNGPSRYWYRAERNGWVTGSAPMWARSNTNWARWEFDPTRAGAHRLLCYISDEWGIADARYRVYIDGELDSVQVVDQSLFADEWIVIDAFDVPSGRSEIELRLGDRSPGPRGIDIFAGRCELHLGGDDRFETSS